MTHIIGGSPDPIFTNAIVYRVIASEALARCLAWDSEHVRSNASGGRVIDLDLTQSSFKDSLVAIVFAGMFMEAALWIACYGRLGPKKCQQVDDSNLEDRPKPLGIHDTQLREDLKHYREARKELVHEKAVPASQGTLPHRTGQEEAKRAVDLMLRLEQALKQLPP